VKTPSNGAAAESQGETEMVQPDQAPGDQPPTDQPVPTEQPAPAPGDAPPPADTPPPASDPGSMEPGVNTSAPPTEPPK